MNDIYEKLRKYDAISGVTGAIVLLCLFFLTDMPFWLTIIISGIIYVGLKFLLPSPKSSEISDELQKAIDNGKSTAIEIQKLSMLVQKNELKNKLKEICQTANQIFANLQKKPQDAGIVSDFLDFYLGTAKDIIQKYIELSAQKIDDKSISDTLIKAEDALNIIDEAFKKQLTKLMKNEAIELDVQVEVLKEKIELD